MVRAVTLLPYSGTFQVTLDAKHRVILPAALRKRAEEELADSKYQGEFFLTRFRNDSLELYTAVGFLKVVERMKRNVQRKRGKGHMDAKKLFKRFTTEAVRLSIGEQGRVLIPVKFVEAAGLEKNQPAVIVGAFDVIEIWSPDRHAAYYQPLEEDPELVEELMTDLTRDPEEDADLDEMMDQLRS